MHDVNSSCTGNIFYGAKYTAPGMLRSSQRRSLDATCENKADLWLLRLPHTTQPSPAAFNDFLAVLSLEGGAIGDAPCDNDGSLPHLTACFKSPLAPSK